MKIFKIILCLLQLFLNFKLFTITPKECEQKGGQCEGVQVIGNSEAMCNECNFNNKL